MLRHLAPSVLALALASTLPASAQLGEVKVTPRPDRWELATHTKVSGREVSVLVVARVRRAAPQGGSGEKAPPPGLDVYRRVTAGGKVVAESGDRKLLDELGRRVDELAGKRDKDKEEKKVEARDWFEAGRRLGDAFALAAYTSSGASRSNGTTTSLKEVVFVVASPGEKAGATSSNQLQAAHGKIESRGSLSVPR